MRLACVFMACLILLPLRSLPAQVLAETEIERLIKQLASDSFWYGGRRDDLLVPEHSSFPSAIISSPVAAR